MFRDGGGKDGSWIGIFFGCRLEGVAGSLERGWLTAARELRDSRAIGPCLFGGGSEPVVHAVGRDSRIC